MIWKIIKILWGVICLLCLIIFCEDFYTALKYPEPYHFGVVPAKHLWYYKTQGAYLWFVIVLCLWFVVGFLFCLLQNKFRNLKWGIIIHLFFTLLRICGSLVFFSNFRH
jgi:hypothetical protein